MVNLEEKYINLKITPKFEKVNYKKRSFQWLLVTHLRTKLPKIYLKNLFYYGHHN